MNLKKNIKKQSCVAVVFILLISGLMIWFFRGEEKYTKVDLSSLISDLKTEEKSYTLYDQTTPRIYLPEKQTADVSAKPASLHEEEKNTFTFSVASAGRYYFGVELDGESTVLSNYAFSLQLDGSYPFEESTQLFLNKQWIHSSEQSGGNMTILPVLKENSCYISYARSDKGYHSQMLAFYLSSGSHTITLEAQNQDLACKKIFFESAEPVQTVLNTPSEKELVTKSVNASTIMIQAENPAFRSKPSILEQTDRESPATIPACVDEQIYNTFGGSSWSAQSDSASWNFTVEHSGYYQLNLRCRQDYVSGIASARRLYIDGKIPSQSTELVVVPYSGGWQKITVSENGSPAWFYLEAGEHQVALECTIGEMAEVLEIMNHSLVDLNTIYRRIIMVVSTNPDPYRDYNLETKIPEVFSEIQKETKTLQTISDYITYKNGGRSSETAILDKMIKQLEDFYTNPEVIATQISSFNANISAIGSWIMDRSSQPLEMDWLAFVPFNGSEIQAQSNFFSILAHNFKRLMYSYIHDYNIMNAQGDPAETVDVWVSTGREQAQIVQRLCREGFTSKENIGINFKLVQPGAVMSAVIAGKGPDVTIMSGGVVNYALRHAVVNLSGLDGFQQAASDFYESALVPFRFNGGVYALPETQSFGMLFYRKDILKELGLEVPQTWDEVYNTIADLQKNNMSFGVPGYDVYLYQNGGVYYANNGEYSLLNSPESIQSFKTWTSFYSDFDLPLSYNFINRFRTGEMPMAVQDYSMYNSLVVFAPEIRNLWDMTLIPGTADKNGDLSRAESGSVTGAFIFTSADNIGNSWKFLKWWVSGDTQSKYAREVEIKLGISARVNVASKSAFENQMWSKSQARQIKAQWQNVVGTPDVPGGYFVDRHINNAFRKIVYKNCDVRETLNEYVKYINKELTAKRIEFGLEDR